MTHPDMVRYFMTIPEAVQLIIRLVLWPREKKYLFWIWGNRYASLTLLATDPAFRADTGQDIEIKITGIRPGEKLREEFYRPGKDGCYQVQPDFVAHNGDTYLDDAHMLVNKVLRDTG